MGRPREGPAVDITWSSFTSTATVAFGPTAATSADVLSPTEVQAVAVPGSGTVDEGATTADGPSAADQYTYLAVPMVTGRSSRAGPTVGGTEMDIYGSGFD
jgi:hypothetical protein